jgi:hypothetical protein
MLLATMNKETISKSKINQKFEYRNSKQFSNFPNSNDQNVHLFRILDFGHSNLSRASDFGFRILDDLSQNPGDEVLQALHLEPIPQKLI